MSNKLQQINVLNGQIQEKYASLKTRTFKTSFIAGLSAGMAARAMIKEKEHDKMIAALQELSKHLS